MSYCKEEKLRAREILLKISSDKIQQHITYIFAYMAGLYSIYQVFPNNIILKNDVIIPFISICFLVFLFGRFLYWSDLHGFIMIVAPSKINIKDNRFDKNAIWAIQNGAGNRIMGRKEWEGEKRSPKTEHLSSLFFERKTYIRTSLELASIIFVLIYVINYTLSILN